MRTACIVCLVSAFITACRHGQTQDQAFRDLGSATLDGTRSYVLAAPAIGRQFKVDVSMPMRPVDKGTVLPVVYVLDGDAMFGTAELTSKVMQLGRDVPPMIVVGIGYYFGALDGWDKAIKIGDARTQDLTESRDPDLRAGGGSDAFLRFLDGNVKPFVESRYPVDKNDQTLVGHSLSALFVLHTLLHSPQSFHRYIAGSPSLWWNREEIFKELDSSTAILDGKIAFVSIGGLESDAAPYRSMSNFEKFTARLKDRASLGLDLTVRVFADETHVSGQSRAIVDGLKRVFSRE